MGWQRCKDIENSKKYKYIRKVMDERGKYWWKLNIGGKMYKEEREAALAIDKILLEKGREPVNILKRKIKK